MRYLVIVTCRKAPNQYKLCNRKNWSMAKENQKSAWLKKEQLLIIKLSEDGIDSSKQLSLAENKKTQNSISHFKSSINSSVIDAPASLRHLSSFKAPKYYTYGIKPRFKSGREEMWI
jgi:hypothetical protein